MPGWMSGRRILVALAALGVMTFGLVPLAAQENRVALVIGNAAYGSGAALKTPVKDAIEITGALARAGFRVTLVADGSRASMEKAIRDFGDRLRDEDTVGLFYYAGHGAQADGQNYLIPVDSDIQAADELRYNAVDAESVLARMRSANNLLNIAVFDASRDNPYHGSRAARVQGLAAFRIKLPESLILLGVRPGAVASEGNSPDSPLARAFVQQLDVPGQDVTAMMKSVIAQVRSETGGRQVPWVSSNLTSDFRFKEDGAAAASIPARTPVTAVVAQPAPEAAPMPDLATLDTSAFVKSLPASRIIAAVTTYGYYSVGGELGKLDARMPPLVLDAYSYAGVKDETLHVLLSPQQASQQLVLYLRAPSGKTSAFFPSRGVIDTSPTLAENGTYILLVATPEAWELGPYSLSLFGRGSSVSGEITIFDPADPEVFGNYMDNVALDTQAATYALKLESSDFDTALRVLDASGRVIPGEAASSGKTTTFTFVSGGGRVTAVVRSDGMWPTGKWKLTIQAVGMGGGGR